ncbi:MAG: DNA topoisomerase, partial [Opitutaceae bacterium]
MKSLVIAEKPSVAADLARALGKVPKQGEIYENDEWVISSAVGHLVELFMPEDIDKKKYGFWRLETLPIIPETFQLKPIESSKDRYSLLKKLLARKDIGQVVNACDAGREGELIFSYIYQLAKSKLPVKRAWMQTMTPEGIRHAFEKLRDGAQMAGLADAARCRSESDWLIGINGTRALTKRMFGSRAGNVASVGRVQTPTLAIIMARELEIRNFKPRAFWRVLASFEVAGGCYEGVFQRPNFKKAEGDDADRIDRIWDKAQADAVLAACQGQPVALVSEEKKSTTQISPRLYDLTTLQREANSRFGLSAKRTLQIAQALYERHKMITYPRTDSRAL